MSLKPVFESKVDNVDAVRMSGGKLFHAAGPAMPNDPLLRRRLVRGSTRCPRAWAAPRILRWGTKQDSRAEWVKKKFVPPLFQIWGTSKQISVGAYWIYCNLLSGCRINKHRSKDYFHWTAPPPYPAGPKSGGTLSPHTPRLRRASRSPRAESSTSWNS